MNRIAARVDPAIVGNAPIDQTAHASRLVALEVQGIVQVASSVELVARDRVARAVQYADGAPPDFCEHVVADDDIIVNVGFPCASWDLSGVDADKSAIDELVLCYRRVIHAPFKRDGMVEKSFENVPFDVDTLGIVQANSVIHASVRKTVRNDAGG